jgi:hypothetical protein
MSRPLTQLTRKNEPFVWTETQQQAFENLKAALTSHSVLAHPRFDQTFILSTDASDYAISAILSQLHGNKERPISFASRMLNAAERNYWQLCSVPKSTDVSSMVGNLRSLLTMLLLNG